MKAKELTKQIQNLKVVFLTIVTLFSILLLSLDYFIF